MQARFKRSAGRGHNSRFGTMALPYVGLASGARQDCDCRVLLQPEPYGVASYKPPFD